MSYEYDVTLIATELLFYSLAKRSIHDRKELFAKGSRKSEEFEHLNGFFRIFYSLQ